MSVEEEGAIECEKKESVIVVMMEGGVDMISVVVDKRVLMKGLEQE